MVKRVLRWLLVVPAVIALCVALYLVTALVTARIPGKTGLPVADQFRSEQSVRLKIIFSALHADIVLPATAEVRARFEFLRETAFPLEHPRLAHIAVGWGSRAFYTTAGTYWDIRPGAVFTAITGDRSVLRIFPLGPLTENDDAEEIFVSQEQFERLLNGIEVTFARLAGGRRHLAEARLQDGDAFFEAEGHFNILRPCNQWLGFQLRSAGLPLGVWTPTSQSLRQSLRFFGHLDPAR